MAFLGEAMKLLVWKTRKGLLKPDPPGRVPGAGTWNNRRKQIDVLWPCGVGYEAEGGVSRRL